MKPNGRFLTELFSKPVEDFLTEPENQRNDYKAEDPTYNRPVVLEELSDRILIVWCNCNHLGRLLERLQTFADAVHVRHRRYIKQQMQ